uniref:Pantothenate kinase n=1 Tax=Timema poppense TaxID=170557 RepID=A0A7R9D869_TIMPO|nr:unnamed protein product [Timema poppensis]
MQTTMGHRPSRCDTHHHGGTHTIMMGHIPSRWDTHHHDGTHTITVEHTPSRYTDFERIRMYGLCVHPVHCNGWWAPLKCCIYKFSKATDYSCRVDKEDEMACLIKGCNFLLKNISDEAFVFQRHGNPEYKFQTADPNIFPYLLVNIGSGVSIMKTDKYGDIAVPRFIHLFRLHGPQLEPFPDGPILAHCLLGPQLDLFPNSPILAHCLLGPQLELFPDGPILAHYLLGPQLELFPCDPILAHCLLGPQLEPFPDGPLLARCLLGPQLELFPDGPILARCLLGPQLELFPDDPIVAHCLLGPQLELFPDGPILAHYLLGPQLELFPYDPILAHCLLGPQLEPFPDGPLLAHCLIGPQLELFPDDPILAHCLLGPQLEPFPDGPILARCLLGPQLELFPDGPILAHCLLGPSCHQGVSSCCLFSRKLPPPILTISPPLSPVHPSVESEDAYERIGGTATGGGTFWGLGSLLTKAKGFDELLALAEKGDHRHIDMLVKDIYGGDYKTLGLPGHVIASSFEVASVNPPCKTSLGRNT